MAFNALAKVTSFLSKPKNEDFSLTYSEHRYEPFWHVISKARYETTRTTNYQVPASGKEVKTVTLQEEKDEKILDGITGKDAPKLQQYLTMTPTEVTGQLKDEVDADAILIPPQARISAIMRDSLSKMITGIQADTIIEEKVEVLRV